MKNYQKQMGYWVGYADSLKNTLEMLAQLGQKPTDRLPILLTRQLKECAYHMIELGADPELWDEYMPE